MVRKKSRRRNIIIVGPGRCGTTLIVRILQHMGYDTGGAHEIFREKPHEIRNPKFRWPYVIKGTGTLCHGLNKKAARYGWSIDVVILCVRSLDANVQSMIKKKKGQRGYKGLSSEALEQKIKEELVATYKAVRRQIRAGKHRSVEIQFPRSAQDMEYCYATLKEAIPDLDREQFEKSWSAIVDPALVRFGG